MRYIPTLLAILFAISVHSTLVSTSVADIRIISTWQGWGAERSDLLIKPAGGGYVAQNRPIPAASVSRLLAALEARDIPQPDTSNLGFTADWLKSNSIPEGDGDAAILYAKGTPGQKLLYSSSFQNQALIRKLAPLICADSHTDDKPEVEITVLLQDGSKIVATSQTQGAFLLPWRVRRNGQEMQTYNADISRAVAEMTPTAFTNHSRLAGREVKNDLGDVFMHSIQNEWDRAGAEATDPKALARLKNSFLMKTAAIQQEDNCLHANLGSSRFPPSFSIGLVLPIRQTRVQGVDDFLRNSAVYSNRVLSVPWLRRYLNNAAQGNAELEFQGDASFALPDARNFAIDMAPLGRPALATRLQAIRKQVSVVEISHRRILPPHLAFLDEVFKNKVDPVVWSRWLILPDGEAVLWRYSGDEKFLPLRNFPLGYMCTTDKKWDTCIGMLFSVNGSPEQ